MGLDVAVFNWINHWPHFAWLDKIMIAIDAFVTPLRLHWPLFSLFVLGLIFGKKKFWEATLFLFLAGHVSWKVNAFLKGYFHRPRPYSVLQNVHVIGIMSGTSFPATLAMNAAMVAVFIFLVTKRWKLFWLGTILFWGLFRVYCGIHYPSDVLAGWAIGASFAWIFYLGYKLFDQTTDKLFAKFKR